MNYGDKLLVELAGARNPLSCNFLASDAFKEAEEEIAVLLEKAISDSADCSTPLIDSYYSYEKAKVILNCMAKSFFVPKAVSAEALPRIKETIEAVWEQIKTGHNECAATPNKASLIKYSAQQYLLYTEYSLKLADAFVKVVSAKCKDLPATKSVIDECETFFKSLPEDAWERNATLAAITPIRLTYESRTSDCKKKKNLIIAGALALVGIIGVGLSVRAGREQ